MPQATIQGILKKHNTQGQLKKHLVEVKALNKIFMVGVVYTENYAGVKMSISTVLRKHGSQWAETRHLFVDRGLVQALAHERHTKDMVDSLEEVCTEDAIECGAQDVEIIDGPTKLVNVIYFGLILF
jgi:transcriptional/translational regulatory protein YebC/TACO1